MKGITGDNMLNMLERRLDNVIYRMGFGTSRAQARQIGAARPHPGERTQGQHSVVPVKPNDVIEVREGSKKNPDHSARPRSHGARSQPQLAGSGSRGSEGPRARPAQARGTGADPVERAVHRRIVFEVSGRFAKAFDHDMFKGFQKPKRLVANTETLTERYGMFTAQPFERGFGSTIGTGLRRVLLSSIEGAAITAVRIEGVAHEFSPIPGVVEDATDIILNLKQVPFKMMGEGMRTVRLKVDAAGEVLSGQIETDQDIEVLDRNMHIATIGEGGKLNIEMRLKSRARLRRGGPQQRRGSAGRLHSDRLGSLAGA